MSRRADWAERLAVYFAAVRDEPFAYGRHDCAIFAAGAVWHMTGQMPGRAWLAAYRNAAGAAQLLKAHGLRAMVEESLGDAVAPALARRGDVILYVHPRHGDALGICNGISFAAPGDHGLEFEVMGEAFSAWLVD